MLRIAIDAATRKSHGGGAGFATLLAAIHDGFVAKIGVNRAGRKVPMAALMDAVCNARDKCPTALQDAWEFVCKPFDSIRSRHPEEEVARFLHALNAGPKHGDPWTLSNCKHAHRDMVKRVRELLKVGPMEFKYRANESYNEVRLRKFDFPHRDRGIIINRSYTGGGKTH